MYVAIQLHNQEKSWSRSAPLVDNFRNSEAYVELSYLGHSIWHELRRRQKEGELSERSPILESGKIYHDLMSQMGDKEAKFRVQANLLSFLRELKVIHDCLYRNNVCDRDMVYEDVMRDASWSFIALRTAIYCDDYIVFRFTAGPSTTDNELYHIETMMIDYINWDQRENKRDPRMVRSEARYQSRF